ncbi:hypothetical protein F5X96DRAFT_662546 [Biscogniauxia mediterranea]|nr:hypothetical protein F5X96DRAFT_662546 [Biscogniauxia mediterranea]
MAILEDLEDLKNYFDVPEEEDDDNDDYPDTLHENAGPAELLMFTTGTPSNKREMLALLPEKSVMDRLMNRYFNSNSPSQHVIHQPTFTKQYNAFLKNPQGTDLHWIATLFMVMALGILFSTFQSPHELELDSDVPAIDRFNQYRGICGWALIRGKYYQPGPFTLQAFLLYSEGEFLSNRMSQMNSYLLSATLIRVMLKMGLHRDPSKLPGITPYEGEMRRRMWNLAIQIDLLVAFHLGLPCMIHGIESDTELPRNLIDSDFDEDTKELPPPRPSSDYTPLTYPIYKAKLARVFGLVARQAHALTLPSYAEVMAVDAKVNAIYDSIPYFMKVKPLEESVTDPPMQVVQRFGLGSLYQKSRCVLHRRYLVEVEPRPEHDYSRRACIDAAVELLGYQRTMIEAGAPGGVLSEKAWFASSLAINDFLLADMILALAIQNEKYTQLSNDSGGTLPSKAELLHILKQSYSIWLTVAKKVPECTKSTEVVRKMLRRIHLRTGMDIGIGTSEAVDTGGGSSNSSSGIPTKTTASRNTSDDASLMANLTIDTYMEPPSSTESSNNGPSVQDFGMMEPNFMTMGDGVQDQMALDPWSMQNGYDWSQFDAITRGPGDVIQTIPQIMSTSTTSASSSQHQQQPAWLDGTVIEDFSNFLATTDTWGSAPSG